MKRKNSWTPGEDNVLRRRYGTEPVQQTAARLQRTVAAVRTRAQRLGIADRERHYTVAEKALVRELYPTHTVQEIAERLLGTREAAGRVHQLAFRLGLVKRPRHAGEVLAAVQELHREGQPCRVIAERLGLTYHQVKALHYRLGLQTHFDVEAHQRAVRTQRERLGIKNGGALRARGYQHFAQRHGWPADLAPREVQILNLLASVGLPMTRRQIAEGIGARSDHTNQRCILKSNTAGGSYLASLSRRQLVQRLQRALPGKGKGRTCDLYLLGMVALNLLAERAAREQQV